MKNVKTIGKEYEIHSVSGKVLDSKKHYETKVSGGGGGGYSNQGTGYTAPVSISSTTVIHDSIFLQDKEGKEHAIQLTNFNVVSREGNELTAVWAIKRKKKRGPYIAIFNHTISESSFNGRKMFWMMTPHWLLLLGAIILFGGVFSSTVLVVLAIIAWAVYGFMKMRDLKSEVEREFNKPLIV